MDDNKITRNILILLIGVASIILAILFANIAYQLTGKGPKSGKQDLLSNETTTEQQSDTSEVVPEPKLYETCVLISTDRNIVLNNREELILHGFPARIKESRRANKLIYSLIIDKQLTREDAILLGEEVKSKFNEIHSYWIEEAAEANTEDALEEPEKQVDHPSKADKTEEIAAEERSLEHDPEPVSSGGPRYEIQIMANTDRKKIKTNMDFLEADGYKLKIIEFKKDGVTYYRLRLADPYGKAEAQLIGNELKQNYKFIHSFWLDKVIK